MPRHHRRVYCRSSIPGPPPPPPVEAWADLDDEEQALLSLVIDAWHAGEFGSDDAWQRYEQVTTDLMPLLQAGRLSATAVHAAGLDAAHQRP